MLILNNVVLGRKFCNRCGKWRHICDFPSKQKQGKDSEKTYIQNVCYACKRTAQRVKYQSDSNESDRRKLQAKKWRANNKDRIKRRRADPEYHARHLARRRAKYRKNNPVKRPKQNLRDADREAFNAKRRERHAWLMKNDPEYVERRREYQIIYQEAKRREAGAKRQKAVKGRKPKPKQEELLPIQPILEWFDKKLIQYKDYESLADACGVSSRLIRRYRSEQLEQIPLTTVDHILVHEGSTLMFELYDYDE